MKIVIINGSARINGATARILHALESCLLTHNDVSVEFIDIARQNIKPCAGDSSQCDIFDGNKAVCREKFA
jgi:multimeric flavodoxin WrbA